MRSSPKFFAIDALPRQAPYESRPEEEEKLRAWQKDGFPGICLLWGILGSGKSNLAARFVEELAEKSHQNSPYILTLSFEEQPSQEACCIKLFGSLTSINEKKHVPVTDVAFDTLFQLLKNMQSRVLIVLDAVDKVMAGEADVARPFGMMEKLLAEAVKGGLPNVHWLLTGRFPPRVVCLGIRHQTYAGDLAPDLSGASSKTYRHIHVNKLSDQACLNLLRTLGLTAKDYDIQSLERLASRCGQHALLLTLTGAMISEGFLTLDAALVGGPGVDAVAKAGTPGSETRAERVIFDLEERIKQFKSQLPATILAVLECLCLFLRPPTLEVLSAVILGIQPRPNHLPTDVPELTRLDGIDPRLVCLDKNDIQKILEKLEIPYRLVTSTKVGDNMPLHYHVHDGIKTPITNSFGKESRGVRRQWHSVIADHLINLHSRSAIDLQLSNPQISDDPRTPDRWWQRFSFEETPRGVYVAVWQMNKDIWVECLHHLIQAGKTKSAHQLFYEYLESERNSKFFSHIIQAVELFFRGSPVSKTPSNVSGLNVQDTIVLVSAWEASKALFGQLIDAYKSCRLVAEMASRDKKWLDYYKFKSSVEAIDLLLDLGACVRAFDECKRVIIPRLSAAKRIKWLDKESVAEAVACSRRAAYFLGDISTIRQMEDFGHDECSTRMRSRLGRPPWNLQEFVGRIRCEIDGWAANEKREMFALENPENKSTRPEALTAGLKFWNRNTGCVPNSIYAAMNLARVITLEIVDLTSQFACTEQVVQLDAVAQEAKRRLVQKVCDADLWINRGVELARKVGYSIYFIDLLSNHAVIKLRCGDFDGARRLSRIALFGAYETTQGDVGDPKEESEATKYERGIYPAKETGRPYLFAATHPECMYVWGELEHRLILAEADMLQVARGLGKCSFKAEELVGGFGALVDSARKRLQYLVKRHRDLDKERPEGHATDPELANVTKLLHDLENGTLPPMSKLYLKNNLMITMPVLKDLAELARIRLKEAPRELAAFLSWLNVQQIVRAGSWHQFFPPKIRQPTGKLSFKTVGQCTLALHSRGQGAYQEFGLDAPTSKNEFGAFIKAWRRAKKSLNDQPELHELLEASCHNFVGTPAPGSTRPEDVMS